MESSDQGGAMLPALLVSHGSPMVALEDDDYSRALASAVHAIERPRAVAVVSAHWQIAGPIRVTSATGHSVIHDFYGFPPALYELEYPAPGSPELAIECVALLKAGGFDAIADPGRGLDHGAWVPLRFIFPAADVPVVQISMPARPQPADLIRLGRALAPLRKRGVFLLGSGGIVHNLQMIAGARDAPVARWARQFDSWVGCRLEAGEIDALIDYHRRAPNAGLAVPTSDHFDPLFVLLGAKENGEHAVNLYEGFRHGSISMRSFWLRA